MSKAIQTHDLTNFGLEFDRRQLIRGSLLGSSLLLVLSIFIGVLHLLLASLGDELGAKVALMTALTTSIGFLAGHILLVTLLALDALESKLEGVSPSPGRSSS